AVIVDGGVRITTLPKPEPGAGEVRIKVRYASVNPTDWKRADHAGPGAHGTPGRDLSGGIDAVGPPNGQTAGVAGRPAEGGQRAGGGPAGRRPRAGRRLRRSRAGPVDRSGGEARGDVIGGGTRRWGRRGDGLGGDGACANCTSRSASSDPRWRRRRRLLGGA